MRKLLGGTAQPDKIQESLGSAGAIHFAHALEFETELYIAPCGPPGQQASVLKNKPAVPAGRIYWFPVHQDRSRVQTRQSLDDAQQCRLAAAARSHQRYNL